MGILRALTRLLGQGFARVGNSITQIGNKLVSQGLKPGTDFTTAELKEYTTDFANEGALRATRGDMSVPDGLFTETQLRRNRNYLFRAEIQVVDSIQGSVVRKRISLYTDDNLAPDKLLERYAAESLEKNYNAHETPISIQITAAHKQQGLGL